MILAYKNAECGFAYSAFKKNNLLHPDEIHYNNVFQKVNA